MSPWPLILVILLVSVFAAGGLLVDRYWGVLLGLTVLMLAVAFLELLTRF